MDSVSVAAALVLAVTFLWSGLAKVARPTRWLVQLRHHRFSRSVRAVALAGTPWTELAVVALFAGARWRAAAVVAIALLLAFCAALVRLWILMDRAPVDCGCFGGTTPRDVRVLLARNAALLALAALVAAHPVHDGGGSSAVAVLAVWAVAAAAWVVWQTKVRVDNARAAA